MTVYTIYKLYLIHYIINMFLSCSVRIGSWSILITDLVLNVHTDGVPQVKLSGGLQRKVPVCIVHDIPCRGSVNLRSSYLN